MVENSLRVKICSLDASQFDLNVSSLMPVVELKRLINNKTHVPIDRQRLIHKGKVLKNTDTLSGIQEGQTIYLVAHVQEQGRPDPVTEVVRLLNNNSLFSRRRRRLNRRREIDVNERLESVRQALLTLENVLSGQREFVRGQWVDVKDTVDQWLEAQVVDIQDGYLFIHYNGWPTRWDEWIESSSERVQPLRTHTHQSLTSPMQSPHLVVPCDADVRTYSHDSTEYFLQTISMVEVVTGLVHDCNEENAPAVIDRTGRLMTDLAALMAGGHRPPDDNASVSSSLITNESGSSASSLQRPVLQIPVMPSPFEVASLQPRSLGPDIDIHVHAVLPPRRGS